MHKIVQVLTVLLVIVFVVTCTLTKAHASSEGSKVSRIGTRVAEYKVCGDMLVEQGQGIQGSKLKQLARLHTWSVYKDTSKLSNTYTFSNAYTTTRSVLLSKSTDELTNYCKEIL